MRIHAIIDFMHIYYKYFFQVKEGKLKRLSITDDNSGEEIDTTLIYYPLRDVEGIRKGLEQIGHDVTMSICFDMPSKRKEEDENYKSDRVQRLSECDFNNISIIEKLLNKAGHNVYRITGYEADDIVNHIVKEYSDTFDYSIIYTNDKDLLINITDKVGVMRFKQMRGYTQVDKSNYEQYVEQEFKVFIPYNMLGLYLSSVGDSADKIKGINKFGPKAFGKLLTKVIGACKVDMTTCGDYKELEKVVHHCRDYLTEEQYEQLEHSFRLVSNIEVIENIKEPVNKSTEDTRKQAYESFKMMSLV